MEGQWDARGEERIRPGCCVVCSVAANLERKPSDELERHVPRDGFEYVIPITKRSRNHPVMFGR